jgi:hypothetical protein
MRLARSEQPGLPDALDSSRACRWHLPIWQAPRCGRRLPRLRRVPQPNRIGRPRSLTPILSALQKPKWGEPPIRRQDTTEHRRPDAASRGGHTHRRGSPWHRARRLSARGFRAPACLGDGRTWCSGPHLRHRAQAHLCRNKDRLWSWHLMMYWSAFSLCSL